MGSCALETFGRKLKLGSLFKILLKSDAIIEIRKPFEVTEGRTFRIHFNF